MRGELSDMAVEVDAGHQFFSARKPGHLGLLCCLTYCLLNPNGAPPADAAKQARDHSCLVGSCATPDSTCLRNAIALPPAQRLRRGGCNVGFRTPLP